eukprot:TRINITY_DN3745_c0_g1_i3.p1 TRINITY_DN3745_c0_g1~~TRINITY_DN3745_c0_g1_i3.p1  ORF type:complete len:125 (+),score=14.36 TRINITY_DN3745_c0_g1_i3:60-434(+)
MSSISKVTYKDAETMFHTCDMGNKGYLDREDYKTAVISLFGLMPTDSEIEEVFVVENEQKGEDGIFLKKEKFISVMIWRSGSALNCYNYERLIFDCLDPLQDGFVKFDDFEKTVQRYFPKVNTV